MKKVKEIKEVAKEEISVVEETIQETVAPASLEDLLVYNGKKFALRTTGFKTWTLPAKKLIGKFNEMNSSYVEKEKWEISKIYMSNPEIFVGLTKQDFEKVTPAFLKRISDLIKTKPELAILSQQLVKNNEDATEEFILEGDNSKKICEILYTDCDIDHSDIALDKLTKQEFEEYKTFMKNSFRFFLIHYK